MLNKLKANEVISDTDGLVGIFGGTFDPIHQGHVGALDLLCETFKFEHVHWVLSARPPHKDQVSASIEQRFEMLQLALDGNDIYIADDVEISRQEKSYTVDTVEYFRQCYPNAKLLVIIGSDSLLNLPSWHRYSELVEQVNWIVMHRPGYSLQLNDQFDNELASRFTDDAAQFNASAGGALWLFENSNFSISSTQLRAELATPNAGDQGSLVKQFIASDVISYIRARHLYKIKPMKPEEIKQKVIEAIEDVKGQDIRVLDIGDISNFADYMVVVSGTSDTCLLYTSPSPRD